MDNIKFTSDHLRCRILGIDNGTDKVGFTVSDYDIPSGIHDVIHCETYQVPSNYRIVNGRGYHNRGSLMSRIDLIADYYERLLIEYDPDIIGCESPFAFRMINAFRTLTISMQMLDDVAYRLLPHVDFVKVSPFEAKCAAAGDMKFSKDKDIIHDYLLKDPSVVFREHIDVDQVGQDALDSVTVVMATAKHILY